MMVLVNREHHEDEDVTRPIEAVRPARVASHQQRAYQRLQRVAGGDPERGGDGAGGADIDQEGPRENDGPEPRAPEEYGGEGNAGQHSERW
jgi:hypothetical protein